ncbi:hypothetical protein XENTR_v10022266 [Xenopus tropicalis]|uniref:Olfactory receptor 11L1-like n=1 Tax=Xenopus tropicalis TaxID=8364 RepID=A0A8J1IT35_XENTR|nr:olfactory receptor 11L1-like [Xenopus tropicalis]KAE8587999.1 hypothetical protein XENTR_v10022266 [Xenopus tropicalis]
MEDINKTDAHYFILLAFQDLNQFQLLFFLILFLIYIICITGNVAIIVLVKTDISLHTPMYFFISVFATSEIFFVSTTVPSLLVNLISDSKSIPFTGCFVQLCVLGTLGGTECYLLAVMAFDRDLAINYPLRYSAIMRRSLCIQLGMFPWITCLAIALVPTIFTAGLEFCGPRILNHFICDLGPLVNLACFVPFTNKAIAIFTAISEIVLPFIITLLFYIHIIAAIIQIRSENGKKKAFSTCSSHLIVSCLFYSSAIIVYVTPEGSNSDKYLALIYTVVTPLLNPFIYTFRNKDVKIAFTKLNKTILQHIFV